MNVNFNIVLMVTQMLMQRIGLNPFSTCVCLHHHSLNTKLDTNVDVDANADVKFKQGFIRQISGY